MQLMEYVIPMKSRSEFIYLCPIGDIHDGTPNFDEKKFLDTIEWIRKTPNAYALGMGDYAEFINYSDKRFDPHGILPRYMNNLGNLAMEQCRWIVKKFTPIRERIIGLIGGNHEQAILERYHFDPMAYICGQLIVPNLQYSALIRLKFVVREHNSRFVTIWAHHGHGTGRTTGSAINNLKKKSEDFDADIYLMGHVHKSINEIAPKLHLQGFGNDIRIAEGVKLYAITGTFYKAYEKGQSSYSEKAGYSPTPTGITKIRIEPFRKKRLSNDRIVDLPARISVSE